MNPRVAAALGMSLVLAAASTAFAQPGPVYDVVIRGGRVLDGAGNPWIPADVTIFDEDRIDDVATYENPTAYPRGIDYLLVNGRIVIDQGRHTGAKPGSILRGAGYEAPAPNGSPR